MELVTITMETTTTHLLSDKNLAATEEDLAKIRIVLSNTNVIEASTKNDSIQSGNFINSQLALFLLLYSQSLHGG